MGNKHFVANMGCVTEFKEYFSILLFVEVHDLYSQNTKRHKEGYSAFVIAHCFAKQQEWE